MGMLFNLTIMAAIAYGALALVIFFSQSGLIYYPEAGRNIVGTPDYVGFAYEPVEISTGDGETLHGWFVPAPAANVTVLFFHGNAGNISHRMEYLLMFHRLGYNTFIFDYRGYGQSSGSPSESGTYLDAQSAWLAMNEKPGMLVLASVFTSVPDMAAKMSPFLPVRLLSRFDYNTIEYLKSVTRPTFIAHSPQDEIVPFAHGRALYQVAPEPKQFLELRGGHNNGFIFMQEDWVKALGNFIDTNLGNP